jgi:RNA polymerase primary sigma factor
MKKQTQKALNLTADYAARALHFLIADGKLAIRDVTTALSRRKKLMKQIMDRFTALETSGAATTTATKAGKATPRKATSRTEAAARAKAGARAAARAAGAKRTKSIARSATTKRKASPRKAAAKEAVSHKSTRRIPIQTSTRPGAVRTRTTKPTQAPATTAAERKPRPDSATESAASTPAPAPAPKSEGRKLPKVANPEHGGGAHAPLDRNQV